MTVPRPILRFLADTDLSLGPFGLLGIPPQPAEPSAISGALGKQLARLARHPLGNTPEADEVRLALHVAAAQLMDRQVQDEILLDLRTMALGAAGAGTAPVATEQEVSREMAPTMKASTVVFERAVRAVLAHSGGWNRESQRRIAALAHTFDLDLVDAVRALTVRTPISAPARGPGTPPAPVLLLRPRTAWRWLAPALLVASLVGSVVMLTLLARLTIGRGIQSGEAVAQRPAVRSDAGRASGPPQATDQSSESAAAPSVPAVRPTQAPKARESDSKQVGEWAALADAALAGEPRRDPLDALDSAVQDAQLNRQAAQMYRGERRSAPPPQHSPGGARRGPAVSLGALTSFAQPPDGDLAALLLKARRSPGQHLDRIRRLQYPTTPLGPADCDAVVSAAFIGSPQLVQSAARRLVSSQLDNPAMLHAALEAIATAPARPEVSLVIEELSAQRLPPVSSRSWRPAARGALIARLAELLAENPDRLDFAAERLLEAWRSQSGESGTPLPSLDGSPGDSLTELATGSTAGESLAAYWLDQARVMAVSPERSRSLEDLRRRHAAAALAAVGPVQRAAVSQRAASEYMGLVVSHERPDRAGEVERVLREAATARSRASHILQQIELTERAVLRLWRLRLHADGGSAS